MRHGHKKLSFFLCRCMFAVYIYIYHMHCPNDSAMIWNHQPAPHQLKLADAKRFFTHFLIEFSNVVLPLPVHDDTWNTHTESVICTIYCCQNSGHCISSAVSETNRACWGKGANKPIHNIHLSSLCAESARAVTGRRCQFYGNSCNFGMESRKIVPKVGN